MKINNADTLNYNPCLSLNQYIYIYIRDSNYIKDSLPSVLVTFLKRSLICKCPVLFQD